MGKKKEAPFAIFTKDNRTLVVANPTGKQLKKYDKNGWKQVPTEESQEKLNDLVEMVKS